MGKHVEIHFPFINHIHQKHTQTAVLHQERGRHEKTSAPTHQHQQVSSQVTTNRCTCPTARRQLRLLQVQSSPSGLARRSIPFHPILSTAREATITSTTSAMVVLAACSQEPILATNTTTMHDRVPPSCGNTPLMLALTTKVHKMVVTTPLLTLFAELESPLEPHRNACQRASARDTSPANTNPLDQTVSHLEDVTFGTHPVCIFA